jgi:3-oxoadipate enol-lactonase
VSVVEARTGSLSWDDAGPDDAPGLVLVHSLGCDSRMWDDQIAALTPQRRVVWMDLPGHGRSGANGGEYTIDELGSDILLVASAAGLNEFDLCGISLGGLIALWIGVNHPERLRRLIVCSTAPRVGTAEMWSERMAAIEQGGLPSVRSSVVPRFITSDLGERLPEKHALVYEMFDSIGDTGYLGCCAALRDADLTGVMGDIPVPTLIVAGSDDVATPPEVMEPVHQAIEGSRMEVIDGAAHLVNIDRPEDFDETLAAFLAAPAQSP